MAARVEAMDVGLQEMIAVLRRDLTEQVERLRLENDSLRGALAAAADHTERRIAECVEAVRVHAQQHAEEVGALAVERSAARIARLERAMRAAPSPAPAAAPSAATGTEASPSDAPVPTPPPVAFDAASYAAFEDEMRGPSSVVAAIQRDYLADVGAFARDDLPVLDLGSGRGEFLRLVRDAGIRGAGVDLNPTFVDECRDDGLDVAVGDAVGHLRTLGDGSLRGITAFHVVEHLPMGAVMELLASALRVVAPGGGLILETPDPANLAVGAHRFWFDPTHLRPIPSALLAFLARDAGFEQVEVRRLHPLPPVVEVPDGSDPATSRIAAVLNEVLAGPVDYAIIARRPLD